LNLLGEKQDEATALKNLVSCDRFLASSLQQHRAIRLDEQSQFENGLRQKRQVWVVADWGTGIDDFLAASLERFRQGSELIVFHLRCDEATDPDAFESLFTQQFGLSLQRFCSLLVPLNNPFLFLDKIYPALNIGEDRARLKRIISAILDYCPSLRVIATSRTSPHEQDLPLVELKSLEPPDVRTYLLHHPETPAGLCEADTIEKLHERSGGLPMHLDRMIRALKVSSLESVLEAELEFSRTDNSAEDVPKALVQAVTSLDSSPDRKVQRSFRLLKILAVLPYGEIIDSLRHFLPREPFYIEHAIRLYDGALLDTLPLYATSPEFGLKLHTLSEFSSPKILKVPRQVRDFVITWITEEEYREIIAAGADHFFGRRWREGKIKPRTIPIGYQDYLNSGPGNEFTIIHSLLQDAKSQGDSAPLRRAARLAVDYCRRLKKAARYRDLEIVAGGILQTLETDAIKEAWAELGSLYGMALRMTGKGQQALDYLRGVLERSEGYANNPLKASIYLNIAYAEENLENIDEAVTAAEEVKRLTDDTSAQYLAAVTIIESNISDKAKAIQRMKEIRELALSKKFTRLADNISLELASRSLTDAEKIKFLDSVLENPVSGVYNKTRAMASKAKILSKDKSKGGLGAKERTLLTSAYIYARSQRYGDLFDKCHEAMWQSLEDDREVPGLLRLFAIVRFYGELEVKIRRRQLTQNVFLV
jgi:tetratricopeptide (TPR) repeat protein